MKNNTNIYDIDDKLIRAAGDNHKFTLEEAQEKLNYYQELLKNTPQEDPKYTAYTTYIRNLTGYIMNLYAHMPAEEIEQRMKARSLDEQIKSAMEELKNEVDTERVPGDDENRVDNTEVEQPVGESTPTIMDEYVPFTEVNEASDEYVDYEEIKE